jgi:hypothetical protein
VSAQGHLNKCLQADTLPSSPFGTDFVAETTNSPYKRTQKTLQLPKFRVYEDQTLRADRS